MATAPLEVFAQATPPAMTRAAAVPPGPAPIADLLREPAALANWLAAHSLDAGAAAARVAQAQALVGTAGLRPNLQVGVGLGGLPIADTNPPGIGTENSLNYGLNIAQQFEIGKRSLRITAADLRLSSQRHALTDALGGSLADAREAIGRVLYLKSRQAALQEGLDTARQILDLQRTRFERGDLSGNDLDRLQLDTQVLEADRAQSRADYADSLAACASVLFAPCDPGSADLAALAAAAPPAEALAASDLDARLADRPDVLALQTLARASEQDEALANKRKVPDPIVGAGYTARSVRRLRQQPAHLRRHGHVAAGDLGPRSVRRRAGQSRAHRAAGNVGRGTGPRPERCHCIAGAACDALRRARHAPHRRAGAGRCDPSVHIRRGRTRAS